jgi:predicted acyl esterase
MRVKALAANEPKHLKAIAPATLTAGTAYRLVVVT